MAEVAEVDRDDDVALVADDIAAGRQRFAAIAQARRTIGLSPAMGVDGAAAMTLVASARAASASSTERRSASAEMPLRMASAASIVTPRRAACAASAAISANSARSLSAGSS